MITQPRNVRYNKIVIMIYLAKVNLPKNSNSSNGKRESGSSEPKSEGGEKIPMPVTPAGIVKK